MRINPKDKNTIVGFAWQFIKFGIVGVSNSLINLAVYYGLIFLKLHYLLANLCGFLVSVMNAYYWNNKYVFKKTQQGNTKPFIKTLAVYGATFFLGSGLLFGMVHYLNISELIAPLINTCIMIPLNFLLNRFWAFK